MTNVMIKFAHGLGDCIQLSIILKHIRKHRPDWQVDVRVGRGKHSALRNLCHRAYHDQEKCPDDREYNNVWDIGFYENYNSYNDRPCTKVTNCLWEVFGIDYDHSLSRYEVSISADALDRAAKYLQKCGAKVNNAGSSRVRHNVVLIHYEGNTSPSRKNLSHWQAKSFCEYIRQCGRIPIILDWDNRSPLPDQKTIFCPTCDEKTLWDFGSGDAEVIAALISLSEAYVGIDSGPDKIASAVDTPTLINWVGHHPMQFHDPAPNTIHLLPHDHKGMSPVSHNDRMNDYFLSHYKIRTYQGEQDLVTQARKWLQEVLSGQTPAEYGVSFVMPNGIGDVMWALLKIKSIAKGKHIDILLSGDPRRDVDLRSIPFLKRFKFIRSADVLDVPILKDREHHRNDDKGRYRYKEDGLDGSWHYLVPNTVLERGERIEQWQPEHQIDWSVVNEFDWSHTEKGDELARVLHPFVAFYLGPESGNTNEGHNRDWLWEPKHWMELATHFKKLGLNIAVVGAHYDRSFYERYVKEGVEQAGMVWHDLIGKLEIGETLAFLKKSKVFISYQCGLGIMTHYFGGRVVMWWRPDGSSCHPDRLVSFDEAMRHSWVNPKLANNYIGAVYRRESPGDLLAEMDRRNWLR